MTHMYQVNKKKMLTYNPFRGCEFGCTYCEPSFKQQAKRDKHRCELCYNYTPHFHPERLKQSLPKNTTMFVCSMGDISFATPEQRELIYQKLRKHPSTQFMIQSKDPRCFLGEDVPENVYIGTTIETNHDTKSISKAPNPIDRYHAMLEIYHSKKYITIEPILDFDHRTMVRWIHEIRPHVVWIGYDNHNCHLREPPLSEVRSLIAAIESITAVNLKTIRRAWWEK